MTGTCKFCGQTSLTDFDDKESADQYATDNCNCKEGQEHRSILEMVDTAKQNVDGLFADKSQEVRDFIKQSIDMVMDEEIKSVTFKVDEISKCVVTRRASSIKLTRKLSETQELESYQM